MKKSILVVCAGVLIGISVIVSGLFMWFYLNNDYTTKINQLQDEKSQLKSEKQEALNQITSITSSSNVFEAKTNLFVKNMRDGFSDIIVSSKNEGYAESNYDLASSNYQASYYDTAKSYADSANSYYGYASGSCDLAEGHFKQAVINAPSENLKHLASLYVNYSEYDSQINSEMHQANEYFASACNYYSLGDYVTGGSEISQMTIHIDEHDRLVPLFNAVLANIEAWS